MVLLPICSRPRKRIIFFPLQERTGSIFFVASMTTAGTFAAEMTELLGEGSDFDAIRLWRSLNNGQTPTIVIFYSSENSVLILGFWKVVLNST